LANLECGGVNRETERLFAYHHGTKHSYRAVRTNTHFSIGIISLIPASVDAYAQKADAYFQEMLMLSRKVDRLERWVMELTDKLNAHLQA